MLTSSGGKVGGRIPLVPHRSTPMLCRTSQSNMLAKKFVITQMGNKLHKVQESAASAVGDKHQAARRGVKVQHKFHHLQYA